MQQSMKHANPFAYFSNRVESSGLLPLMLALCFARWGVFPSGIKKCRKALARGMRSLALPRGKGRSQSPRVELVFLTGEVCHHFPLRF
jgi:hypothetical protein